MNAPPTSYLEGTPFGSYVLPGLALLVLVFEIVEVMTIGSDPGVAGNLQVFYFLLGFVITLLATTQWRAVRPASPEL